MILYCKKCGHIWKYTGTSKKATSCPTCKKYVNIINQQVDCPLPVGGDYSNAEYMGVSAADPATILYYDPVYEVVVEYLGEPDPFSRSEETSVSKAALEAWLKNYHWSVGFKFLKLFNLQSVQ